MVSNMKTTIDVADPLLDAARLEAARRGTTLRALVEEGLSLVLARRDRPGGEFRLGDASVAGSGLRPELEGGTWDDLRSLAYEGRGG